MLSKIFTVYRWILYPLIIIYLLVAVAPMIFGIRPYIVLSASMEPTIKTGALSYINTKDRVDIHTGDIVAFEAGADDGSKITVIHRIYKENEDGTFLTKGDNNDSVDFSTLYASQIVGRVKYSIPELGKFTQWLQSKQGIVVAVGLMLIAFISSFLSDRADVSEQKEDDVPEENSTPPASA